MTVESRRDGVITEADTCREFVTPKLAEAGWSSLQCDTPYGQEAKPLPYMLVQMNLLLHDLEAPQIAYGNTLERRVNEIGHSERVAEVQA